MEQKGRTQQALNASLDNKLQNASAPSFGPAHRIPDLICRDQNSPALEEGNYDIWHGSLDQDGKPHGFGKYVFSARSADGITYIGNLDHGYFEGKGLVVWPSGLKFEGNFQSGVAWNGELLATNGQKIQISRIAADAVFQFSQINWRTDTELNFPDGVVYVGPRDNTLPHGTGRLSFPNKDVYDGQFSWGVKKGKGIYKFADGKKYEGEFADGTYNGSGVFDWGHGTIYQGGWKNGLMHGRGEYRSRDGWQYSGDWEQGIPHGHGVESFKGQVARSGLWEQGHFVRSDKIGERLKTNFQPIIEFFSSWYPPFSKEGRESVVYKWGRIQATSPRLTQFEAIPLGFVIPSSPERLLRDKLEEIRRQYERRQRECYCSACAGC